MNSFHFPPFPKLFSKLFSSHKIHFLPLMDLETLVSVCRSASTNERKITCETLADNPLPPPETIPVADDSEVVVPPDFPPESFWLSEDAEFDWFDRNAFIERKESTKANNSYSYSTAHSNSNSQRFISNLKSLGLPKPQKSTFDSKRRQCRPANIKLFPKKPDSSVGKTTGAAASLTEPSSPKVSCIGRVRSKRCRRKPVVVVSESKRSEDRKSPKAKKSVLDRARSGKSEKVGILYRISSMFRSDGRRRRGSRRTGTKPNVMEGEESVSRKGVAAVNKGRGVSVGGEAAVRAAEPPGLGGMTRFVSGRRSQSFGSVDFDVASRESLDLGSRGV